MQYPVKALLRSGVFEGKTTAEELATLEQPLSDKELCVAAAFLEEEEIIEEEDEDEEEDALAAELAPIRKQLKEFEEEYEKAKRAKRPPLTQAQLDTLRYVIVTPVRDAALKVGHAPLLDT